MSRYVFKMPDLGEGTVEAEIVEWRVGPGDMVSEDQVMVEVMTDKAAVEVPSPVSGRVLSTTGQPGDKVPVGADLIVFDTAASAAGAAPANAAAPVAAAAPAIVAPVAAAAPAAPLGATRVMASPATRRRAREAGIDLRRVAGSGPGGRISPRDLDAALSGPPAPAAV
jgi:pyruvate/2-oxoglutarate dehydrogenase complex dihydrolipoamide acyltransferase (E2) component